LTWNKHREVAKNMKVKELTVEEFKILIQEAIEQKLEEITGDPDLGLELREEIKERLRGSLAAVQGGEKGIPIEQVARQAGLDW
jgi:hypothetical protein